MRRTAVIAGSVLAALATGGVLAVSGGAQAPGTTTIQLTETSIHEKFVDVPPKARKEFDATSGDQFLFTARLHDSAGKRAGTLDAKCSFTKGGRKSRGICEGVFELADGELYLMARLTTSDTVVGAIIGGSGAYAGARGTFTSVDRPGEKNGDPSDDTITLLP